MAGNQCQLYSLYLGYDCFDSDESGSTAEVKSCFVCPQNPSFIAIVWTQKQELFTFLWWGSQYAPRYLITCAEVLNYAEV